jgi:hypothetical protein
MLFKPLDFGIAIPAMGMVIASFFLVYAGANEYRMVYLKSESGEWVFPADTVETVVVSGPLGDTIVAIQGGAARITDSPCMNQTCVTAGAVRLAGQWAACLPNRVMVYIGEGTIDNEIDASVW